MSCEILAEVSVKGLVFLGENPTVGTYICAATTVNPYTTTVAPYVCTGIISGAQFTRLLASSEASQEVLNKAIDKSCSIAVEVGTDAIKIIAFKAGEIHKQTQRQVTETRRTFSALNTAEGLNWLMRYLSSM